MPRYAIQAKIEFEGAAMIEADNVDDACKKAETQLALMDWDMRSEIDVDVMDIDEMKPSKEVKSV